MRLFTPAITLSLLLPICAPARGDRLPDFEQDVKPIFAEHCFKCHGPEKQKGGLRLDVKTSVMKGGDSGDPAIVPGNAGKSQLLTLVTSHDPEHQMPPKGDRLRPEQLAVLQKWVETGAHWLDLSKAEPTVVLETAAAEQPIPPQERQFWSFVAPKPIDPPPTRDAAWARTRIDRLILARLEAHKLTPSPEADPAALIRRLSYDLTGLPPTPPEVDAFLSDATSDAYEHLVDRLLASPRFGERMASLWLPLARYAEDQAHQVGSDTKFFYPNAWKYREWVINAFNRDLPYDQFLTLQLAADRTPSATPDDQAALGFLGLGPKYYNRNRPEVMADEWEDRVDTVCRTTLALTVACARCHDHKFDPISQRDYYGLAGVFASTRMVNKTPAGVVQNAALKGEQWDPATLHIVEDGDVQDLNLLIRGSVERKGPVVPRRFLAILSQAAPVPFKDGSGRRELAAAITSKDNPLTARVMANRVWGMLFGAYLVPTPSNFGHSGQPPTYPELLDDLAVQFMDGGWSIKCLIREIVLSSTYRQSARSNARGVEADPANVLLWRMNRRRLTAEQWRDTILFVSGRLQHGGGKSMELDDTANFRRTVYARVSRLKLNEYLAQFDYPDANVHAEKRSVTSTPAQKLFTLNSPFVIEQAKALARRLETEAPDDESRVRLAYRMLFARDPSGIETRFAIEFLHGPASSAMTPWQEYAQILLASNEALYVD